MCERHYHFRGTLLSITAVLLRVAATIILIFLHLQFICNLSKYTTSNSADALQLSGKLNCDTLD